MISLFDQHRCAARELALRRNVYPAWVKSGKMTQKAATHELDAMAAIVSTLDKMLGLEEVSLTMRGDWKLKPEELFP